MLKSFLTTRPEVIFDPEDPAHRAAYFEFVQTCRWGKSPYRFILEEPFMDLPSCIASKMIDYYSMHNK